MKYFLGLILSLTITICLGQDHSLLGINVAKQELKQALSEKRIEPTKIKRPIKEKKTAITIAENILFEIYSKNQIVSERPYEVYLINGYWVMNGTLPKRALGGGFLIIISAKDGQLVKVTHYK